MGKPRRRKKIGSLTLTSDIIKTAVLSYYRFRRHWLCMDEVFGGVANEISDVLVQSPKGYYDVEVKISKYDLWNGEMKKHKHRRLLKPTIDRWGYGVNYFVLAVPESLIGEAIAFCETTNKKYGILGFDEEGWNAKRHHDIAKYVWVVRTPKLLMKEIPSGMEKVLLQRLSSGYINLRQKDLRG